MHEHDCFRHGCYLTAPPTTPPTVVTFWLELTALADGIATFTSTQTDAETRLPVDAWETLGRPGFIETRTVGRNAA